MAEETLRETLEKSFATSTEPPDNAAAGGEGLEPPSGSSQETPQTDAGGDKASQTGEGGEPGYLADTAGAEQRVEGQGNKGSAPAAVQPKPADQQAAKGAPDSAGVKPPQSWRPEIREHWGKLPPEVQQEITRRETQVTRALNDASQYVSHYNQFNDICAPYASMIAMDGGNPLNTFKEFLKTAATLRIGAPNEKAEAIANACMQFGIDVQQLDTALAARLGGKQGQRHQQPQQQFQDPRLDQLLGQIQLNQQTREQELMRSQQAEIDQFAADPKNEFFHDVKMEVANILEVYANQGIACSLKDAYEKACLLHPSVSKTIAARNQAAARNNLVRQNNSSIEAKRRAALMPPGSPNIGPGDNNDLSLRDTIAAAMQQAESRV